MNVLEVDKNTCITDNGNAFLLPPLHYTHSTTFHGNHEVVYHEGGYYGLGTNKNNHRDRRIDSVATVRLATSWMVSDPDPTIVDIETTGLEASDRVVMVGIKHRDAAILLEGEESVIAPLSVALIQWTQPNAVVGYNIDFDITHLKKRWEYLKNNGEVLPEFPFSTQQRKFRVGMEDEEIRVHTLNGVWFCPVVDLYPLTKRMDVVTGGRLGGYSLKQVVAEWGISQLERHEKFHDVRDEERWDYLLYDLLDTERLFTYVTDWFFGLRKYIPIDIYHIYSGFGFLCNLFLKTWLGAKVLPSPPEETVEYDGGLVVVESGFYAPVYHIDVVSMYPHIMVKHIVPRWDKWGVFPEMVRVLLNERLEAKRQGKEQTQRALKILINSLYGFLASSFDYSDPKAATEVTAIGRDIIRRMASVLEQCGYKVVEMDTDGIYFTPTPTALCDAEEAQRRVEQAIGFQTELKRYRSGLFVKKKNYALWTEDGELVMKGNSLRSRRDNVIYAKLVHDIVSAYAQPERTQQLLLELWQKCFDEYSLYDVKTLPKTWWKGREPQKDKPDISTRLDRLEKLKNVFLRFELLPHLEWLRHENRVVWRQRLSGQHVLRFA